MRSRLVTLVTTLLLVAGSGGALAIAQLDNHPNTHGGAADDQYNPGKGCGNRNQPQGGTNCKPKHTTKCKKWRNCRNVRRHRGKADKRSHRRRHQACAKKHECQTRARR